MEATRERLFEELRRVDESIERYECAPPEEVEDDEVEALYVRRSAIKSTLGDERDWFGEYVEHVMKHEAANLD